MINIHRIQCGNGNCYVLEENGSAILVDTGKIEYQKEIEDRIKKFPIKLIVLTHAHFDHCENADYFSKLFQVPIAMNKKDGDSLEAYGISAKVISLSGHTKGSIGIDCKGAGLIVGDALMNMFYPTISMLYGNRDMVLQSAEKISKMGDIPIYFGHGKSVNNRKW